MPFSRQVECGRVALVNYGDEYGTLVGIVDIIDANRVRPPPEGSPPSLRVLCGDRRVACPI